MQEMMAIKDQQLAAMQNSQLAPDSQANVNSNQNNRVITDEIEEQINLGAVIGEPKAVVEFPCDSLNALSEIIKESEFYLGNDSGIMHMSVAEKKRCIVFFGPTDEKRTGPFFIDENRNALEHLIIPTACQQVPRFMGCLILTIKRLKQLGM